MGMKLRFWENRDRKADPNANRPVKMVPDGYNSWRVVYAD